MVLGAPQLLATDPATWRRDMAALELLWIEDPPAVAERSPHLLCHDLAAPGCVATRLLLQHIFRLTPAGVYERLPGACAASSAAEQLACRLSYLQERGLPLPAAAEGAACEAAAVRGCSCGARLSLADVAALSDEALLAHLQLLAQLCGQTLPINARDDFESYRSIFASHPAYRHLLEEAGAEAARLQRLLRPT